MNVARRIDYHDDPSAPAANSLVPSVNVVVLYTSNGEVRQEFSIVLTARQVSGTPTPSDESKEVRWVPATDLTGYTMDRSMRIRINDYLRGAPHPVVD